MNFNKFGIGEGLEQGGVMIDTIVNYDTALLKNVELKKNDSSYKYTRLRGWGYYCGLQ